MIIIVGDIKEGQKIIAGEKGTFCYVLKNENNLEKIAEMIWEYINSINKPESLDPRELQCR